MRQRYTVPIERANFCHSADDRLDRDRPLNPTAVQPPSRGCLQARAHGTHAFGNDTLTLTDPYRIDFTREYIPRVALRISCRAMG